MNSYDKYIANRHTLLHKNQLSNHYIIMLLHENNTIFIDVKL